MDGSVLLPEGQAKRRQAAAGFNQMLLQLRINTAHQIHEMLLAKAIRMGEPQGGEEWRGVERLGADAAKTIAEEAVLHTDAFMAALGFKIDMSGG